MNIMLPITVFMLLCCLLSPFSGCSLPVGSQNRTDVRQLQQPDVVIRFAAQPAEAPKAATVHEIIFARGQTAFALGDYYQLSRSTDGGRTWQSLTPTQEDKQVFGGDFKDMVVLFYFVSPSLGWMSSEKGVWRTEDGGETWRLTFPKKWSGIDFADEQHGWLSLYEEDYRTQHYITQDGGKTWQACGSSEGYVPSATYFLTPRLGWAITSKDDMYAVARTADGGCNWEQLWVSGKELNDRFSAIYFLNEQQGWLGGGYIGSLLHTIDGGKTWHRVSLPLPHTKVSEVYFTSSHEGWLVGESPAVKEGGTGIYYTKDGGKSWRQLTSTEVSRENTIPTNWETGKLLRILYTGRVD